MHQRASIPITTTSLSVMTENARNFLRSQRNSDAGWAYFAGKASAPEPTCYAAMALTSDGVHNPPEPSTVAWIARHAEAQEPLWTRSLSLLALRRLQTREDMQAQACPAPSRNQWQTASENERNQWATARLVVDRRNIQLGRADQLCPDCIESLRRKGPSQNPGSRATSPRPLVLRTAAGIMATGSYAASD